MTATAYPPGPSSPRLLQLARWLRAPTQFLEDCAREYGDTFSLRFPGFPVMVVVTRPEDIKAVFTGDIHEVEQGPFPPLVRPQLGDHSLFFMNGERHLRERKLLMPPLHGPRLEALAETMRSVADAAIDRWPTGREFSFHHEMQRVTLDIIQSTVFGVSDAARLDELRALLLEQSELQKRTLRLRPLLLMLSLLVVPGPLLDRLYLFSARRHAGLDLSVLFPWRPAVRQRAEMSRIIFAEIARARGGGRPDILSMLAGARDEDGAPMSDDHLRDEMLTLLVAGHETSATGLSWCMHLLLDHPDVLRALREELAAAGGLSAPAHAIVKLELLEATVQEALRLRPVVPHASRTLRAPIELGGCLVPAGTVLLPSIYLAHRHAGRFEQPERFDPSRFMRRRFSPYEYFPFGGGVRRCIGMAFAMYEMKVVLAQVLLRTDLRQLRSNEVRVSPKAITLTPSNGVPVIVTAKRAGAAAPAASRTS